MHFIMFVALTAGLSWFGLYTWAFWVIALLVTGMALTAVRVLAERDYLFDDHVFQTGRIDVAHLTDEHRTKWLLARLLSVSGLSVLAWSLGANAGYW